MKSLPRAIAAVIPLCIAASAPAQAQNADQTSIAAQRAAIAVLSWMDGEWRGEAVTQSPSGPHRVTQTERIGSLLGGSIKLVEGKGFNRDGTVGFNAFGVIAFDPRTKAYTLHSWAQGREGNFALEATSSGYVWRIPAGPGTIVYTAKVKDGHWNEVGDRIVPGKPPQRFFEMNLTRLGDGRWPAGGGLTPP